MAIDRVQLKQEEVVNSTIVLKDINPKSSTNSIDDSSTGVKLTQTIDRIWNSINNKLSRVVNSVNGRTGVVVLKSSDVGLGNVDNVSYGDIKTWVINKLNVEFGNKRIKLFNSLHEVDTLVSFDDKINRDTAFYCEHGFDNDHKSYIGYIYLDTGTNKLGYTFKQINTVGYTDNSLIYDETVNDTDLNGGGVGVNIYRYEDALYLYNGLNKATSGLRIKKDKLVGDLIWVDGVYGDGTTTDTTALLYYHTESIPPTAKTVNIFIDDRQVVFGFKLRKENIKVGDILICNFKDYRNNDGSVPTGMSIDMMLRKPCVGRVTNAPSEITGEGDYQIKFYSIKPNLGWGLQHLPSHQTGITDSETTLRLLKRHAGAIESINYPVNYSGLQVYSHPNSLNPNDPSSTINVDSEVRRTVLPYGPTSSPVGSNFGGGISITPDMSMNVMPYYVYGEGNVDEATYDEDIEGSLITRPYGSKFVDNWAITSPGDYSESNIDNGCLTDACLFGINVLKATRTYGMEEEPKHGGVAQFSNLSGLRINQAYHVNTDYKPNAKLSKEKMGLNRDDYSVSIAKYKIDSPIIVEGGNYIVGDIVRFKISDSKWSKTLFKVTETNESHIATKLEVLDKSVYEELSSAELSALTSATFVETECITADNQWSFGLTIKFISESFIEFISTDVTTQNSGGLSVNVGKFLEIEPGVYHDKTDEFYDSGKVNVRIGKGLTEEDVTYNTSGERVTGNRIQVDLGTGLGFDENGKIIVRDYNPKLKRLIFKDATGTTLEYNPLPIAISGQPAMEITLGAGLKIE